MHLRGMLSQLVSLFDKAPVEVIRVYRKNFADLAKCLVELF